jgi:hypothetical protein
MHRRALVVSRPWGFHRPPKLLRTFSEEFLKEKQGIRLAKAILLRGRARWRDKSGHSGWRRRRSCNA